MLRKPLLQILGSTLLIVLFLPFMSAQSTAADADFVVYSVYRPVDLGLPNTKPEKDFYINMGTKHGLKNGNMLEVSRRTPTYDVTNKKLFQDVTFPIAKLRVIHVEDSASIARLNEMLPYESTPSISPNTVMVGDIVKKMK